VPNKPPPNGVCAGYMPADGHASNHRFGSTQCASGRCPGELALSPGDAPARLVLHDRCAMWCSNCQQDVAGVLTASEDKPCCIRCGDLMLAGPLARGSVGQKTAHSRATYGRTENRGVPEPTPLRATEAVTLRAPLSGFHHWELEEQLRHVERVLSGARFTAKVEQASTLQSATQAAGAAQPAATTPDVSSTVRAGDDSARSADATIGQSKRQRFVHPRHDRAPRSRATLTTVVTGAGALACGIGLLICGWLLRRPELQSMGLPITLLGQGAVLIGMLVQLDRVWRDNRRTDDKLSMFQRQLENLENLAADLQTVAPHRHGVSRPTQQRTMAELKQRLETLSHRLNSPSS